MDRQRRRMLGRALLGSGGMACPMLTTAALSTRQVTVALTARNSLYHLPLVLADRLGYFRPHALQVHWLPHESGAAAVASAVQGKADVLAGAFEHLFELQHKGYFFQAFVQMNATPMLSLGQATGQAPRTWQNLKGARIGVSALASGTHWMSRLWLLHHGVQPQDVQFVEVGTSASALGALWEGQIDALCSPDPVMHWLEQRGDVRLMAQMRTLTGVQQVVAGALPGGCLMAREDFLLRQPQVATVLASGVLQALRWLQTAGPTDLFKTLPVAPWIGDRAVYLGAMDRLRDAYAHDGQIQEAAVFNAWRVHTKVAGHGPSQRQGLARTFTNAFAARAKM